MRSKRFENMRDVCQQRYVRADKSGTALAGRQRAAADSGGQLVFH